MFIKRLLEKFKKQKAEFREKNADVFNNKDVIISDYERSYRLKYMVLLIVFFSIPALILNGVLGIDDELLAFVIGIPLFIYSLVRANQKAKEKYNREHK